LILKLNREPLAELSEETIKRDREHWKKYTGELIGDWVTGETLIKEICDFGERVYLRHDLTGFQGGIGYARNESAQKAFARLRSAIGGLYAWRAKYAKTDAEKRRMNLEAELAFKQALALGSHSQDACFRHVELLLSQQRKEDAMQVAKALHAFDPKNTITGGLLEQLRNFQITSSTNQPATN
jgi:hypothetical protein